MDNSRSSSQIFIPDFDSYEYDAAYATFNREQNRDWIGGDIPDVLEDNRHLMRSNMIEDVEYGHEFQNGAIKPLPSVPASRRVTWASNLSIDSKQSNHNNPQQHEKLSKSSSSNTVHDQRYCCGLFRTRKSCFSYCAPITLVLLIALGILGYFIFPRMPELQVGVPKSFEFVQLGSLQEFQSANPSKPFTANFTVDVNVGVDSSNLIDWKLDLIETEGFLIHPKNYKSQEPTSNRIGYGASRNIIIKSNAKTNIPFTFTMSYLSTRPLTAQLIVQDEQLEALVDSCDPTAFNRPRYNGYPTGQINVKIFPQVTILGFVKFNIGSRVVSISCPDEIRGLFDLLKTGP